MDLPCHGAGFRQSRSRWPASGPLADHSNLVGGRCLQTAAGTASRNPEGRGQHRRKHTQACIQEGHAWVADFDLERFFDRVNHDVLLSRVRAPVTDRRVGLFGTFAGFVAAWLGVVRFRYCAAQLRGGFSLPRSERSSIYVARLPADYEACPLSAPEIDTIGGLRHP
jgi:hypothetical protein